MTPFLRNFFVVLAVIGAGYLLYDCNRFGDCLYEHRRDFTEHAVEVCK